MLGIFAHSFMTATRTGGINVHDVPPRTKQQRRRWLPLGHWWLDSPRVIDANKL